MKNGLLYGLFGTVLGVLIFSQSAAAFEDHTGKMTSYEGSKTCRVCHEDVMDDVTHSIHYRLLGQTQGVYDFLTNKTYPADDEKGKGNRY